MFVWSVRLPSSSSRYKSQTRNLMKEIYHETETGLLVFWCLNQPPGERRGMPRVKYWLKSKMENFLVTVAWKLPKDLVYWATIRLVVNATEGEYSDTVVTELTMNDALTRWTEKKK